MESQILGEQIEQLRHKQHIQNIILVKLNQYHVMYSPQLTNSPYSHLTYRIKLIIPEKYPEAPPKLIFMDRIYHLNIEQTTGVVKMPVLSEDWSPYLTLVTVFDTLDILLEQPDLHYSVSPIIKQQYTDQPQKYLQKVEQMIRLANQFDEDMENSVVEHVEVMNDSQYNQIENASEEIHDVSHPNFTKSEIFSDIPIRKPVNNIQKSQQIRVQTESYMTSPFLKAEQVQKPVLLLPQKSSQESANIFKKTINIIQKPQAIRESESMRIVSREISNLKQSNQKSNVQFQKMRNNLKQADILLNLLVLESNSMEEALSKSQNSRVKQLLQKKQDRIIEMLEQMLELSSQLREKLFATLQKSSKYLLK